MCGCAEVNKTLPYIIYIEETHYSERMIANMSKASALVDVSKKRVNPFKAVSYTHLDVYKRQGRAF